MRQKTVLCLIAFAALGSAPAGAQDGRQGCDPYGTTHTSPVFGGGLELGIGRQQGAQPLSGLATYVGAVWDVHFVSSVGLSGHLGVLFGSEAGVDADGDGQDDVETGDRRAFVATAGPGFRLGLGTAAAYLGLSFGAGYMAELAGGESGAVLDATLAFGRSYGGRLQLGLRFLGGVGAASDTRALLLSGAFSSAGGPDTQQSGGCPGFETRASVAYGLGAQAPLLGMTLSSDPAATLPGLGVRLFFQVHELVDLYVEADVLALKQPGVDPLTTLGIAGGLRFQHRRAAPISASLSAGYSHAHGTAPLRYGSGAVLTGMVAYDFANLANEGFYLLLGSRFGLSSGNRGYRALFVGLRMEIRSGAYRH